MFGMMQAACSMINPLVVGGTLMFGLASYTAVWAHPQALKEKSNRRQQMLEQAIDDALAGRVPMRSEWRASLIAFRQALINVLDNSDDDDDDDAPLVLRSLINASTRLVPVRNNDTDNMLWRQFEVHAIDGCELQWRRVANISLNALNDEARRVLLPCLLTTLENTQSSKVSKKKKK
jgi:hypothetical protein